MLTKELPLPVRDVGMLRVLEMCALCQARAAVVVDPVTITGKKKVVSRRIKHALSYYTQYQGLVLTSRISEIPNFRKPYARCCKESSSIVKTVRLSALVCTEEACSRGKEEVSLCLIGFFTVLKADFRGWLY